MIEENGLGILNGNKVNDQEKELTFMGKMGNLVLDYAITEVETCQKISEFKIAERTELDHQTTETEIKEKSEQREVEEEVLEKGSDVSFEREGVHEG